jgi:hypothetical protein
MAKDSSTGETKTHRGRSNPQTFTAEHRRSQNRSNLAGRIVLHPAYGRECNVRGTHPASPGRRPAVGLLFAGLGTTLADNIGVIDSSIYTSTTAHCSGRSCAAQPTGPVNRAGPCPASFQADQDRSTPAPPGKITILLPGLAYSSPAAEPSGR